MTVTAAREPVEFEAALRGFGDRYWHRHPFHERLHAGNLREDELRLWVANRWYYQKSLPQKDAAIVANCPVGEVRRRWLNRIVYQDGPADGEGGLASWLDLAEATGLSRAEVLDERHVVPGVRFATDAYVTFARTRPWEEAVAASLTEIFSPDLMRNRIEALRTHYAWVEPGGHHYFHSRADQARKDADYALEVVLRECTSRLQQDAALAAVSFKCDMLWAMLDTIEHATRRLT